MRIIYSAVFVNESELKQKYPQVHPNAFYHHSTIDFKPNTIENLPIGEKVKLNILGRLTTDKVDVLLVDNPLSKNAYPHITLSTSEGVKPFESNGEILRNLNKVKPLNDSILGICGVFDGTKDIIDPIEKLNESVNRFYQMSGIKN